MNSLYVFNANDRRFYVAAKTWKEARNIIARMPEYKDLQITEIIGKRIAVQITDLHGILSPEYVFDKIPWWTCKCGNRSFMLLDDGDSCRCRKCGREMRLNLQK